MTLLFGWRAAFFLPGALGLVWLAVWLLVYRTPAEYPGTTRHELDKLETETNIPSLGLAQWFGLLKPQRPGPAPGPFRFRSGLVFLCVLDAGISQARAWLQPLRHRHVRLDSLRGRRHRRHDRRAHLRPADQIGRASCRGRG